MKTYKLLGLVGLFITLTFGACYQDLGNYDYREINEINIGDNGFVDTTYILRSFVDTLRISPKVEGSMLQNPDNYEYKWVAVGDRFKLKGTWVIGEQRELVYPMNLPEQMYTVFLHVTDKSTGIVTTRSVQVSLQSVFTEGWLLWGVNEKEEAQLDMVAFVGQDTFLMKDILKESGLPSLKKPTCIFAPPAVFNADGYIQLGTEDGSYRLDRDKLTPIEDSPLKYAFFDVANAGNCVLNMGIQLYGFRTQIIDGNLYYDKDRYGGYYKIGNASNHYKGKYELFKMGDKLGFNMTATGYNLNAIIVYDDDNKRFTSQGGGLNLPVGYCTAIPNKPTDPRGSFSWEAGKDFVTTINSRKPGVSCYTILKTSDATSPAGYYLCGYNIIAYGFDVAYEKKVYQALTKAENIDKAKFYVSSTKNSIIFYTVGNKLCGFNYVTGLWKEVLDFDTMKEPETITGIWYNQDSFGSVADEFYLALYNPKMPASTGGRIVGYNVADNINDIIVKEIPGSSISGLCKIGSITYKSE